MDAFLHAVREGDVDQVRALGRSIPDPNKGTFATRIPALVAARHGQLEILKFLLEELHADVNLPSVNGVTPLLVASSHGHLEVVIYT